MITTEAVRMIAAAIASVFLAGTLAAGENGPTQSLVAGETAFGLDLYSQLKGTDGNLFFSPYSISTCLGMTYAGARGETARAMAKTLHFDAGPTELPTTMGLLEKELNQARREKGIELRTANGLWGQVGHPFLPAFLQIARQQFSAIVNQADFRTQAEPTRKTINDWVSEQTKGKINDLLPPGILRPDTRLVLVNAIYFKGKWVHQFKKTLTADAPFTVAPAQKVQAHLMNIEESFKYAELPGCQLLELPYTGDEKSDRPNSGPLSMIVLLPKDVSGLTSLEGSLGAAALANWIGQAREQKVNVFLPKFKMTAEFKLSQTLARMGMQNAFSTQADFSGMDGKLDLFISDVVHKAYVDVNEEGTEAAAATGVGMRALLVMQTPVFRADHPFIFFIRDNRSGSILFLGRVNDPTK